MTRSIETFALSLRNSRLTSRVAGRNRYGLAITGLMLVRLIMWWLLLHDIPPMTDRYNWHFNQGGDQVFYFNMAEALLAGSPMVSTVGTGWPLIMAGLMRIMDASDFETLLYGIVIWNGIVLGLLSISIIGEIARGLTGSQYMATAAAGLWTMLPYLLWLGFGVHPEAQILRNAYVPRQMFMTGITDGPSIFFAFLSIFLMVTAYHRRRSDHFRFMGLCFAGGISLGFGAAIRIHILPVAVVLALALVWTRRWPGLIAFGLGLLVGFAPQLWYNAATTGHILNTPYLSGWLYFSPAGGVSFNYRGTPFALQFLLNNFLLLVGRLPLLTLLTVIGLAFAGYAFVWAGRERGAFEAIVMFGAPLASFALHVLTYIFAEDPLRFTLPAFSLGLPAIVWTMFFAFRKTRAALAKKG